MTQPYLWETIKDLNRLAILFPEREAVGIDSMKEGKANRVRAPFLHFFLLADKKECRNLFHSVGLLPWENGPNSYQLQDMFDIFMWT